MLAIDPGTDKSAYVVLKGKDIIDFDILENKYMLDFIGVYSNQNYDGELVVEMVASYGMPVGREVFETCVWIGRFIQRTNLPSRFIYRRDVKLHLCESPKARDATIKQSLIDIYGPGKDKAIGRKATPGPLYGIKKDMWQALAVGLTAQNIR